MTIGGSSALVAVVFFFAAGVVVFGGAGDEGVLPGADAPPVEEAASATGAHSAATARTDAKIELLCLGEVISTVPFRGPQLTEHTANARVAEMAPARSHRRSGAAGLATEGSARRRPRGEAGAVLRARRSAAAGEKAAPERRAPRLRRAPVLAQRQPAGRARRHHAGGVGVAAAAVVALREQQHVLRQRGQPAAADRAAVGGRLAVGGRAHLPPGGRGAPGLHGAIEAMIAGELGEEVAAVAQPVLIVAGRDDMLVPLSLSTWLASALPDARLEVLEDTGHLPMIERPARFNELLLEFAGEAGRSD